MHSSNEYIALQKRKQSYYIINQRCGTNAPSQQIGQIVLLLPRSGCGSGNLLLPCRDKVPKPTGSSSPGGLRLFCLPKISAHQTTPLPKPRHGEMSSGTADAKKGRLPFGRRPFVFRPSCAFPGDARRPSPRIMRSAGGLPPAEAIRGAHITENEITRHRITSFRWVGHAINVGPFAALGKPADANLVRRLHPRTLRGQ